MIKVVVPKCNLYSDETENKVTCADCRFDKTHADDFPCNDCEWGATDSLFDHKLRFEPKADPEEKAVNRAVEHPNHYNRDGALECIEEMRLVFGDEAVLDFLKCSAWKYRYRAYDKNGEQDINKADNCVKMYKKILEDGHYGD